MSISLADLKQEVARLSADERAELARDILASLEAESEPNLAATWQLEIERRDAELVRGEVQAVPAPEVFDRLRRRLE